MQTANYFPLNNQFFMPSIFMLMDNLNDESIWRITQIEICLSENRTIFMNNQLKIDKN